MAKKKNYTVMPAAQLQQLITEEDLRHICMAWEKFEGPVEVCESAIGSLLVGRFAGYDALRMIHSYKTLRRYEEILGVKFSTYLPGRTADSRRMNGIRYADNFKQFWKALAAGVSSEPGAREAMA